MLHILLKLFQLNLSQHDAACVVLGNSCCDTCSAASGHGFSGINTYIHPVSVTRLSCFVDSLGPFVLLTCYHGGRFCHTDIVEDHKRLITINNYFSQDWNDFNLAVRISSLRFSFGRDWNDKFQLRCSNDKFQLRCSNSTESDQSHARRPENRNCHPVDRGRLRIPKHITNEMHEWVKTGQYGWGRIGSR